MFPNLMSLCQMVRVH